MHQSRSGFAVAALATATLSLAQQPEAKSEPKPEASPKQQLHAAFQAMDSLPSYRVDRTHETTDGSKEMAQIRAIFAPNRVAAEMDRAIATTWSPDLLFATADEGKEHLVQRGRRMIARMGDDGEWCLRKQRFARGARAPQPLDPTVLFDVLRAMNLDI